MTVPEVSLHAVTADRSEALLRIAQHLSLEWQQVGTGWVDPMDARPDIVEALSAVEFEVVLKLESERVRQAELLKYGGIRRLKEVLELTRECGRIADMSLIAEHVSSDGCRCRERSRDAKLSVVAHEVKGFVHRYIDALPARCVAVEDH